MFDTSGTVSCPFCTGKSGTCCRCNGTRRVPYKSDLLVWCWHRHGCDCDACRPLKAQWERIQRATEPGRQPEPPAPEQPARSRWADYPACSFCGKRGPHVERHALTWLHLECRAPYQAVEDEKRKTA